MRIGFRAGSDPAAGVREDDFAGTLRAWRMPESTGTLIGRVFPSRPFVGPADDPQQVIKRLERACAPVLDAGMTPHLSLKPDVTATISGKMDPLFTAIGEWVAKRGQRVYFSVWHEPENDAMAAGPSKDHTNHVGRARNFVNTHSRAYRRMKAPAGDLLVMGPCYMSYHWRPGSATTTGTAGIAWRVPADARDFVGVDTYTSNGSLKRGAGLRVKTDFQRWKRVVTAPNRDILVVERGITQNPPDIKDGKAWQANVLNDDLDYGAEIGMHGYMYWNSGGATDDSEFRLGEPGRRAMREHFVVD